MSYLERLTANNSALETILNKVLEYNESIVTFDPTKHMTYTGQKTVIDDGNGNWRVKFLSSGTLTFTEDPGPVDVFLVGGGGGGSSYTYNKGNAMRRGGAGGGGGYTLTDSGTLEKGSYEIIIGAGGAGGAAVNSASTGNPGADGGDTTAFDLTANGGKKGSTYLGGDGGSGGGNSDWVGDEANGNQGGSDGGTPTNGGGTG